MEAADQPHARAQSILAALTQAADEAGIALTVHTLAAEEVQLVYANAALPRLLGISTDEFESRSVWSFVAPDELPKLTDMHARRLRGDEVPRTFGTVLVRADGGRVPVDVAMSRIELDGRPATVTFVFDATHHRQAQAALTRSEADFRTLAENAPDGIAITRWPIIAYVNRTAATMLGFDSPSVAIGQNLLDRLTPIDARQAADRAQRRIRGEQVPGMAEYAVRGSARVVEISATPIEYAGAPAMLAFARDVTERRAIVTRLMESEKLAAVGMLAAGVAHEINNPLAYMLLNLEFVIRELPKLTHDPGLLDTMLQRLEQVRHGGERVKTIVRDLQSFTRRHDGDGDPVQLEHAVDAALNLAGHELRNAISVVRRFQAAPPVLGNTMRFEQLFLNLLLNAVHAIANVEPQRQLIEVEVRPEGDGTVLAIVRDHGVGMDADTLGRAFEPFFTTKPLGEGTGLGLPICHNIVRAAGGELRLNSAPGEGTTAELRFPSHRASSKRVTRSVAAPALAVPRRGCILVVDDEPAVSTSIALALQDEHEVVTCSSAAEAYERLCTDRNFDVVLCDLVMPIKGGAELFEEVRAHKPELASRFVFITGGASLPHSERFLSTVDNPRLGKPFDLAVLRSLLQGLLSPDRKP